MLVIVKNGQVTYNNMNSRQYDGEKVPGDLKSWNYFGTDPNSILFDTYNILSQRATTLYHTHAPVNAAINKRTTYAVGPGLLFRSQPDWEILGITKDKAKDWGRRFQKLIHYMSVITNFYEKQSVLYRTAQILGDSLLFFDRSSDLNDGMFDLIEFGGDIIDFQHKDSVLGVKVGENKKRQGIWLENGKDVDFVDKNNDQNVIQYYRKQMARQMRGFPLVYKIISHAKNNDRWWDATLSRLVMETMILGYSKEDDSRTNFNEQAKNLGQTVSGQNVEPTNTITREENISDQAPGGIYSYSSKGGIEFTNLKTPSNNFDKVQNAYIDIVGMATDTPPEVVLSRYSTSYTAHKGAFNDFIKSYMLDRKLFANTVCKIFVIECAKYLFLNEMIEVPNMQFFNNRIIQEATVSGNYLGPVPSAINPLQEVTAKEKEVQNAFDLRSNKASEYGNDYENMILEWHEQEEDFNKQSAEEQAKRLQEEMQNNEEENNSQDNNNSPDDDNNSNDDENQEDEE